MSAVRQAAGQIQQPELQAQKEKRMKLQKKRLVQQIPAMTPPHLNIKPVQVDAVIGALFALLASHQPSRVLEFMEAEEKKRCAKLGE